MRQNFLGEEIEDPSSEQNQSGLSERQSSLTRIREPTGRFWISSTDEFYCFLALFHTRSAPLSFIAGFSAPRTHRRLVCTSSHHLDFDCKAGCAGVAMDKSTFPFDFCKSIHRPLASPSSMLEANCKQETDDHIQASQKLLLFFRWLQFLVINGNKTFLAHTKKNNRQLCLVV